ncbi:MAG: carbonic anhydrase [Cellvibrionaceae bacterium]
MITAEEALTRLKEGNKRFVSGIEKGSTADIGSRKIELLAKQEPFAVVLGCSDSRVPAELVFDQGLGDLFVIRVAGNIVAPSGVGSVEFAVEQFGTPLVIVLGHSNCGAVIATVDQLIQPSETRSVNLRSIVDRIKPSVETILDATDERDTDILVNKAVRANIRSSVHNLCHGSRIIEEHVDANKLKVVGAEYSLETGIVDFFDC